MEMAKSKKLSKCFCVRCMILFLHVSLYPRYIAAVLISMGQARKSTIELVNSQFDYLDGDGSGHLDKEDLQRLQEISVSSLHDLMHLDVLLDDDSKENEESAVAGSQAATASPPKMVV